MNKITKDDYYNLCFAIARRVDGFSIKYKNESVFQKIIGVLLFFNKEYMRSYTTTIGKTVYFTSRDFVNKNLDEAFEILSHEYVHLLDRYNAPGLFEVLYLFPQFFAVFSLFSLLAIWFSPWWLMCLLFLVCAMPLPAPYRAALEMRAYAMSMAVEYWMTGSVSDTLKGKIRSAFTGWSYYKMLTNTEQVDAWIALHETMIQNVDKAGDHVDIFSVSDGAFSDVYNVLTGIEDQDGF